MVDPRAIIAEALDAGLTELAVHLTAAALVAELPVNEPAIA
jgi:hypothetical protein